jgi:hypothetical protein
MVNSMAVNALFPKPATTLMDLAAKNVDLAKYYAGLAPRMGGKLLAFEESIVKGRTDHWLEYVPDSYSPGTPVPLVISVHGGGQDDYRQFYETSWYRVAERTGMIVAYPTIQNLSKVPEGPVPDDFMLFIDGLFERMKTKYTIDDGRVFIQGMSLGNLISTQYGRLFGRKLAGIGMTSGPSAPSTLYDGEKLLYNDGPVAVWQSRGMYDSIRMELKCTRPEINTANRRYWITLNGSTELPRLKLAYNMNWAIYPGEKAPLVYRDDSNQGHNQTSEDAECAWDSLLGRVRREKDGSIRLIEELPEGDKNAVVLLDGSSFAYVDNKKLQVGVPVFVEKDYSLPFAPAPDASDASLVPKEEPAVMETYTYIPVLFLETAFGAKVRSDGRTAYVTAADGRQLCFAENNFGAMVDGRIFDMGRVAKTVDGALFVPAEWYAQQIEDRCVSKKDGAVYIGPRPGKLTTDMVNIIKEILG